MKIELDLNNRASLIKQRAEHERLLAIIDLALKGFNGADLEGTHGNGGEATGTDSRAKAILTILPKHFSISNVMAIMGEDAHRSEAKIFIKKWLSDDEIKIHESGRGRRATVYERK